MTLIKSISGIRGTIGGKSGDGLSPVDLVKFSAAYTQWIKQESGKANPKIVLGRDARISGEMVRMIVAGTLSGMGADVVDAGLATTPTVEMAVVFEKADGGIILTASHNPKQWNALKLLNSKGEFLSSEDGAEVLEIAENESFIFSEVDNLGKIYSDDSFLKKHIDAILNLDEVDLEAIRSQKLKVVVDAVNSVGGFAIPEMLEALGVEVIKLYCEANGEFPHNPEPLPEHLKDISELIEKEKADLGFVVDPDVDRLAIVNEDGSMFGEEYTLVAVADYLLQNKKGATVSNMSSSMALKDISEKHNCRYFSSAVGEVNVVSEMKKVNAVIGGEGNGGVIFPKLHYGRDALVGVALFLSHLAKTGLKCSQLRKTYPDYHISKNKITLNEKMNVSKKLEDLKTEYANYNIDERDGIKIELKNEWVQLRKSNTEPIIRVYAESENQEKAEKLAKEIIDFFEK